MFWFDVGFESNSNSRFEFVVKLESSSNKIQQLLLVWGTRMKQQPVRVYVKLDVKLEIVDNIRARGQEGQKQEDTVRFYDMLHCAM